MKKAILYIFLFGTILSNTCHAFYSYENQNTIVSETIQTGSHTMFKFSKVIVNIMKSELIDDFENEDDDSQTLLIKNKSLPSLGCFLKNSTTILNIICKKTNCKNYFDTNFSRIPRFNYISLNVFLI